MEIYRVQKFTGITPRTSSNTAAVSTRPSSVATPVPLNTLQDSSPASSNTNRNSDAGFVLNVPVEDILEHVSAAELEIYETNAAGRREEEEQKWRGYLRRQAGLRESCSDSASEATSMSGVSKEESVERAVRKPIGSGRRGRPLLKKLPMQRKSEEGTRRKRRKLDQSSSQRSSVSAAISSKAVSSGAPVSGPLGRSGITQFAKSGSSTAIGSTSKQGKSALGPKKRVPTTKVEENDDSEPEYEILRIHEDRLFEPPPSKFGALKPNAIHKYLVEWKDWHNPEDFTWEPLNNLLNAKAEIRKYLAAKDLKRRPKPQTKVNNRPSSPPAEYEVLRIHDDKVTSTPSTLGASKSLSTTTKYLVEWKDWPDSHDFTWEPPENLSNAQTELRKFIKGKDRKRLLKEKLEENKKNQLVNASSREEFSRELPTGRTAGYGQGANASERSSRRSSPRKKTHFATVREAPTPTSSEHSRDASEQIESQTTLARSSHRRKPLTGTRASASIQGAYPSSEFGRFRGMASALSRFKGGLLGPRGGEQPQKPKEHRELGSEGDDDSDDDLEVGF